MARRSGPRPFQRRGRVASLRGACEDRPDARRTTFAQRRLRREAPAASWGQAGRVPPLLTVSESGPNLRGFSIAPVCSGCTDSSAGSIVASVGTSRALLLIPAICDGTVGTVISAGAAIG